ncbi:iron chaperone [Puia dinghuensis]|uniref:YdhG-like domain-containing protein n=1 Tax=Puia dinghuensis TaxID=1792502 RepID=A0A8J2UI04_9BACT|nr:DUF1801 domain-containing protein [Puia dinghuensis]GGB20794.1 hypothetical protein GCM10011511_50690 [Puia dinghuensis]
MVVSSKTKFKTVEQYFSTLSEPAKTLLEQLRATIKKVAPEAEEVISYNIPAFKWNGMLVWYAAFSNHIGLYPRTSVLDAFKKDLTDYHVSKGTLQFPLDKPLPIGLITRIVKFRMKENSAR